MPARSTRRAPARKATKKTTARRPAKKAAPPAKPVAKKVPAKKAVPTRAAGLEKAKEFQAIAKDHGWWTELEDDGKGGVKVTIKREDNDGRKETITVMWIGERLANDGMVYAQVDGPTFVVKHYRNLCRHVSDERSLPRRDRKTREQTKMERITRRAHVRGISVEEMVEIEAKPKHAAPPPNPYLFAFMLEARGDGLSPRNSGPIHQTSLWQSQRWAEICEEDGYTVKFRPVCFHHGEKVPMPNVRLTLRQAKGYDFKKIVASKQPAKKAVRRVRSA